MGVRFHHRECDRESSLGVGLRMLRSGRRPILWLVTCTFLCSLMAVGTANGQLQPAEGGLNFASARTLMPTHPCASTSTRCVVTGHFSGTPFHDVITLSSAFDVVLWKNNGDGTGSQTTIYSDFTRTGLGSTDFLGFDKGDANRDGYPDLFFVHGRPSASQGGLSSSGVLFYSISTHLLPLPNPILRSSPLLVRPLSLDPQMFTSCSILAMALFPPHVLFHHTQVVPRM